MEYAQLILRAVRFAEVNLTEPVTFSEMAEQAAYSKYHFHRLFTAVTGITPGAYLRGRRLLKAAVELVETDKRIIDIAIEYQFQSQESFSRAFKQLFGDSPGRYRDTVKRVTPCMSPQLIEAKLRTFEGGFTVEPIVKKRDAFKMVGMMYYGDNENNEIPALWGHFIPKISEVKNNLGYNTYGFCFESKDYEDTGNFYYMAGIEVEDLDDIPIDMVGKTVPASTYAVFTHKGPVAKIKQTYEYIYGTWAKKTGMKLKTGYDFEFYDERFTGIDKEDSELDIYIPIED